MGSKKRNRGNDTTLTAVQMRAWLAFALLCLIGALLAVELERLHVRAWADPGHDSYCNVGAQFDCNAVATSPYSIWFGLPVAVWGLVGYLAMGALALWGLRRRAASWQHALAFALALVSAAGSVALFLLSHFVIGSICLLCVATYLVNFGLVACGVVATRGSAAATLRLLTEHGGAVGAALAVGAIVVTGTAAAFPTYWHGKTTIGPDGLPVGIDAEGHPWIGAVGDDASVVEIVEYSDYECPHCARGHAAVRQMIVDRPEQLRLVHRHYPLDDACNPTIAQPFHRNACRYARIAWCAQQQGRFWEVNDFLYASRGRTLSAGEVASELQLDAAALTACVSGAEATRVVEADLAAGRAAGVRGTPTFVVNGKLHTGGIPAEALAPGE